jgi:hypothetical protein
MKQLLFARHPAAAMGLIATATLALCPPGAGGRAPAKGATSRRAKRKAQKLARRQQRQ